MGGVICGCCRCAGSDREKPLLDEEDDDLNRTANLAETVENVDGFGNIIDESSSLLRSGRPHGLSEFEPEEAFDPNEPTISNGTLDGLAARAREEDDKGSVITSGTNFFPEADVETDGTAATESQSQNQSQDKIGSPAKSTKASKAETIEDAKVKVTVVKKKKKKSKKLKGKLGNIMKGMNLENLVRPMGAPKPKAKTSQSLPESEADQIGDSGEFSHLTIDRPKIARRTSKNKRKGSLKRFNEKQTVWGTIG